MTRPTPQAAIDRAITEGNKTDGERIELLKRDKMEEQGRRLLREDRDGGER